MKITNDNKGHIASRRIPHKIKKTSSLNNRKIEEKGSFFDGSTRKVIAVALIVLVIVSPFIGMAVYMAMSPQSQTSCFANRISVFEPYLPYFPHNERYMVPALSRPDIYSCKVSDQLKELTHCIKYGEYARKRVKSDPALEAEVYSKESRNFKGYSFLVQDIEVRLSVDPQIQNNFVEALEYVEKTVLMKDFADRDIEDIIKQAHSVLVKNLTNSNGRPIRGGVYRMQGVVIQPDDKASEAEFIERSIIEKHGVEALSLYHSAYTKFALTQGLETMTKDEIRVFNSVYHTPPSHLKVPKLMKTFANEYSSGLKISGKDPFEFAAWVHMQMVNIHPFEDGVGRAARIFMNAELKRAGLQSVVFFDDQAYTKAIENEQQRQGSFAKFLRQVDEQNATIRKLKKLPCLG